MTLSQLEMFIAIHDFGSISEAARNIHRVPSNLTTRIKQLEEQLNTQLFIRDKQKLSLSPAGHNLLPYARQILMLVEEAQYAVTGQSNGGIFALGSLISTATVRIPDLLAEFNHIYRDVQLDLTTGSSGDMIDGLLEGAIAAAFIDGPLLHSALEGKPVYDEEMVIISPKSFHHFDRAGDVNGCRIFTFRANCSYRRHFENWFQSDNAVPGKIFEMESFQSMLACVIAGSGLAMMPRSLLQTMPGYNKVNVFIPEAKWKDLTTWLVWRKGHRTHHTDKLLALLGLQDL
ncbi:LysR family transcriptional regulator [Enterobacteriaceae bacterium RIT697]|uniref:LysR family transcriptional regulator n=1 Tax=Pantoea endophytica TaxID=92488 RepID=UPI0012AD2EDB|nr:LysR family transcriptional regulator [Pantoea endophytica]MRT24939.1 LysR family transcriptional regulator [Enterobacteriaceae bacterium RIT697]